MKPRVDRHKYRGPVVGGFVRSIPTLFRAACACGWLSEAQRVTKAQARADHRLHAERERRELLEEIEFDRGLGVEL